jgi:hypothetical protein
MRASRWSRTLQVTSDALALEHTFRGHDTDTQSLQTVQDNSRSTVHGGRDTTNCTSGRALKRDAELERRRFGCGHNCGSNSHFPLVASPSLRHRSPPVHDISGLDQMPASTRLRPARSFRYYRSAGRISGPYESRKQTTPPTLAALMSSSSGRWASASGRCSPR